MSTVYQALCYTLDIQWPGLALFTEWVKFGSQREVHGMGEPKGLEVAQVRKENQSGGSAAGAAG